METKNTATISDADLIALVLSYGAEAAPASDVITRELAIRADALGWWKGQPDRVVAIAQFRIACLCIPFGDFHGATERAIGRPVWTQEFANVDMPLLQEILAKGNG